MSEVMRIALVATLLIFLNFDESAAAAEQSRLGLDELSVLEFGPWLRPGSTVEEVRQKGRLRFNAADLDGGGVSQSDTHLTERKSAAQIRSRLLGQWMLKDLNGDNQVTRAELEAFYSGEARKPLRSAAGQVLPTAEQVAETLSTLVERELKTDRDGDGVVTLAEADAAAAEEVTRRLDKTVSYQQLPMPSAFDLDGDGVVSESEYSRVVDRAISRFDADGDGAFSKEERVAVTEEFGEATKLRRQEQRESQQREQRRKLRVSCGFPAVPETAKVVVLGAYEGQALSTVALGGDDEVVHVADLWIESGRAPLYLVLSSYSAMIWRVSGAVDRVAFAVPGSLRKIKDETPRVGVVGLPKDRVHIPTKADCLRDLSKLYSKDKDSAAKLVPGLIGRPADAALGRYAVSTVSLPSGLFDSQPAYADAVDLPESGPSAPVWREMLRFNPGGLVQLEAASVVSRVEARPYGVLPQQAGLARLIEEGAL